MNKEGITGSWRCAECGGGNVLAARECWLCLAPRPGTAGIVRAPSAKPPPALSLDDEPWPEDPSTFQRMLPKYTVVFILIFFTLLGAVTFGIGLIPLVVLAPVLIRLIRVGRARAAETPMLARPTCGQVAGAVMAAFFLTLLFVVSGGIAFVAICTPPGFYNFAQNFERPGHDPFAEWVGIAGLVLGLLAGAVVPYLIALRMFRIPAFPCPNCGRANPTSATECRSCGQPFRTMVAHSATRPITEQASRRLLAHRTAYTILYICGLLTPLFGLGLFLAAALTPALIHLFRTPIPPEERRGPSPQGAAFWAMAFGLALAALLSAAVPTWAVYMLLGSLSELFAAPFSDTLFVALVVLAETAGAAVAYLVVRFVFPFLGAGGVATEARREGAA